MASSSKAEAKQRIGVEDAARPVDFNPRLAASSLTGYLYLVVAAVATLVMTSATLYALGATGFGVWALITAVAAYIAVTDFGFTAAVPKFVGELRALHDHAAIGTFLGTVAVMYSAVLLLSVCLGAVVGIALPHLLQLPVGHTEFLASLVLMGGATGLTLVMGAVLGVMHAWQRLPAANLIRAAYWILLCASTVVAALLHGGLIAFAGAYTASAALACAAACVTLRRLLPHVRAGRPSWEMARRTSSYGGFMFLVGLGTVVVFQTDNVVIGVGLGFAAVAPYAAATRLTRALTQFLHKIADAFFPFYAGLAAVDSTDRIRDGYALTTRLELAGAATLALFLLFAGPSLLAAWVGPNNVVAYVVLLLAVVLIVCEAVIHPAAVVASAIGGQRPMARLNNIEAAGNLGLTLALVRPLGVVGVIAGTVIAQAFTNLWWLPRWVGQRVAMSWSQYASEVVLPAVVPALGCAVVGGAVRLLGGPLSSWSAAVCSVALYALSYAALNRDRPEIRGAVRVLRSAHAWPVGR
jgi:O-antigen/teichoic acid export membrane protein